MKTLTVAFLFCLVSFLMQVKAQDLQLQWAMGTGGSQFSDARSMTVDNLGNVYITGSTYGTVDFDMNKEIFNLTSDGQSYIYVSKYDPLGKLIWAKQVAGVPPTYGIGYGTGVSVDSSGNVYITGGFHDTVDFDPGQGEYNLTSVGEWNAFVLKLDILGNFAWVKKIFAGYSIANSITVDEKGEVYVTAYSNNTGNAFILKLSSFGEIIWEKKIGPYYYPDSQNTMPVSIILDTFKNIYVTGSFHQKVDFDPGEGVFDLTASPFGDRDAFILKLDSSGKFIWAMQVGGSNSTESGTSIAIDMSGNIYMAGSFWGAADFNPDVNTFTMNSIGSYDIFISKFDQSGNFVWAKSIGGKYEDYPSSIRVDRSGNILVTGVFRDTADFDPGVGIYNFTSVGQEDMFILKLDSSGNFKWAKQIGGGGRDGGNRIVIDSSNNIYACGYFSGTVDFDLSTGTHELTSVSKGVFFYDIFIMKMQEESPDLGEYNSIFVYPNPGSSTVTIDLTTPVVNAQIRLVNILGQTIIKKTGMSGRTFTFDITELAKAVYTIEVSENGSSSRIKLVKD